MADRLFDASSGADAESLGRWSSEADALLADIAISRSSEHDAAAAGGRASPSKADTSDGLAEGFHAVTISRVIRETADCLSFEFDAGGVPGFRPQPGQFVVVRVIIGGAAHERCYAISSLHMRDEAPRFTVKRVASGLVSNWCHDSLRPGRKVLIGPPQGGFLLRPGVRPRVFLAAGIGIAPLFPMIKEAVAFGDPPVKLVLVDREESRMVFLKALRSLAQQHPGRLALGESVSSRSGPVSARGMAGQLAGFRDADVYVCGPEGFMACAEAAARGAGIAPERIMLNAR